MEVTEGRERDLRAGQAGLMLPCLGFRGNQKATMSNSRFETKQVSLASLLYMCFVQALILWAFSRMLLCSNTFLGPNLS